MPFMPDDHVSGGVLAGVVEDNVPQKEDEGKAGGEPTRPKLQTYRSEGM